MGSDKVRCLEGGGVIGQNSGVKIYDVGEKQPTFNFDNN